LSGESPRRFLSGEGVVFLYLLKLRENPINPV
jgi:hypothetical protein